MPDEDHSTAIQPASGSAIRRWLWFIIAVVILASASTAYIFRSHDEAGVDSPSDVTDQPTSSPSTVQSDKKNELVSRLTEILAMREQAYKQRNPGDS
jgi:hypothetical protein